MHRTAWRYALRTIVLALVASSMLSVAPTSASAACAMSNLDTVRRTADLTCANNSFASEWDPGYAGWGRATSRFTSSCSASIFIRANEHPQEWRWSGGAWSQVTLPNCTWVWVQPWVTGWSWIWTQETGWLASLNANIEIPGTLTVRHCGFRPGELTILFNVVC